MTENTTEVEETFETGADGVAYTSESDASADTPARPATIAPAYPFILVLLWLSLS